MAGRPELHDRQAGHGVEEKAWPTASWSRTLPASDLRLPARQQLRAVGTARPALRLLTDGRSRLRRELHRPHILWLVQSRHTPYICTRTRVVKRWLAVHTRQRARIS
jgi:hypothetical protein